MMAVIWATILLSIVTGCLSQTPTHYTMQVPETSVLETVGTVQICISRTGDDISGDGIAFLTTEDNSATGDEDFTALSQFPFEFEPNLPEKCYDLTIIDDDDAEFNEIFKVTIVGASDGIPGSQPSTEITIRQNDHCTEIPLSSVDTSKPFYVSPWDPESGKPIIFKNTIGITQDLTFYLTSGTNPTGLDEWYKISIDQSGDSFNTDIHIYKNGDTYGPIAQDTYDILQDTPTGETVAIDFDQSTGTITLTHSNTPSDSILSADIYGAPITVRHLYAFTNGGGSGTFTVCNADPIELPRNSADQSGTSQTYPNAVALRAIDGTRSSDITSASPTCSVTATIGDPWWRVDLGREYDVSAVNIYPIADDDASGLDDISGTQVYVGSCNETYIEQLHWCGTASSGIPNEGATAPFVGTLNPNYIECQSGNTYGRYVYIRLDTDVSITDTLALCEVEVYGTQVPVGSESTVVFSMPSYTIAEANTILSIDVDFSGPGASCSAVDVYTEDDTAESSGINPDEMDFDAIPQATPHTITFDPSTTMQSIDVAINTDSLCEEEESFKLILDNLEVGVLGTPSETSVTITDDDTTRYSIEDASDGFEIREGDDDPLEISIIRSGTTNVLQTKGEVSFISDEVGNHINEIVEFESDETEEEVDLIPIDNKVYEEDKTFTIRLQTSADCSALVPDENMATVTVEDDDSRFCFDDDNLVDNTITIPESAGTYRIKLSREGTARDKKVDISIQRSADEHDNAESGVDFTLAINSVTFESGDDEAYFSLTIDDDYYREDDESFDLLLSDPDGIAENIKDPYRITVVIVDDDDIFRFKPNYYSVSEEGQSVNVCLERVGALTKRTTINLETQDVTTTAGRDYIVYSSGFDVTFMAGLHEACTTITILGDDIAETTETFIVHIASDDVETEYDTQAVVSIYDDPDVFISFSSDEYSVVEGEGRVTVYINKVGDVSQLVTASITSSSVTADSGDYVSVSDGIRIPPGQSEVSYDVIIRDDDEDESNEHFRLTLSNAAGAVISEEDTTVTIRDDDSDHLIEEPVNVLSGGVLAGLIVGVVVVVVVTAFGVALFCAYLLRRPSTPIVTARSQLPLTSYPQVFDTGNAKGPLPYGRGFYPGQAQNLYLS